LTDGSIFMQATGGVESVNYILQAATNLSPPVEWTNLGSYSSDFNGRVFLRDTDAPFFPMRFYRAMSP
jgi:hypothetical protein